MKVTFNFAIFFFSFSLGFVQAYLPSPTTSHHNNHHHSWQRSFRSKHLVMASNKQQQPFSSFNFPVVKKVLLAASLFAGLAYFSSPTALAATGNSCPYPIHASDDLMEQKDHGTSSLPVQDKLRWNVDRTLADRISNFNRHYAEYGGYFSKG